MNAKVLTCHPHQSPCMLRGKRTPQNSVRLPLPIRKGQRWTTLSFIHISKKFRIRDFSAQRTLKDSFLPMPSARIPHVVAPIINPLYWANTAYSTRPGLNSCCTWVRETARPWNQKSSDYEHAPHARNLISLSANHPRPVRMNSCHW